MITKDKVLDILLAMSAMSRQELEQYAPILDKNYDLLIQGVELCSAGDESRYGYYIAAKTNYEIALIKSSGATVSTFKAGDVMLAESDNHSLAKEIYLSALADVGDLVRDEQFAFMDV